MSFCLCVSVSGEKTFTYLSRLLSPCNFLKEMRKCLYYAWEETMRKHSSVAAGLSLFVLISLTGTANAEPQGNDYASAVVGGLYSAIATVIAVPVKVATCGVVATVGGVGHGLSGGESALVKEEFLSAIPSACGPYLKTLPADVAPRLEGPQPRDMAW